MAATGLLGINPYQKGVAIDISSKPINLAMQLHQHEEAKKEALDKYFMDYEKTLNPAGMRGQDQDVFLGNLSDAKKYYLQNREQILNPAKYGADAQSEYFNRLKKTQSIIEQSKQAAANDKADIEHYNRAQEQGLSVPDGYMNAVKKSHLPLNHPEYQPLDTHTYNFFKPHDDKELQEKIWGLTKPENITKTIDEVDEKGNPTGKKIDVVNQVLDPVQRKNALYGVSSFYNTHTGTKNMIDNLIQNPSTKSQLDNLYSDLHPELWKKDDKGNVIKPTIENGYQALEAYASRFNPEREVSRSKAYDPNLWKTEAKYKQGLEQQNILYKQNIEDNLIKKNFSPVLTNLVNISKNNSKIVYDDETGQKKQMYIVPLTSKVKEEFKSPVIEPTYVQDPQTGEYVVKPGVATKQKTVDEVLYDPETKKFRGYYQTIDPKTGKATSGKFPYISIDAKDIAGALIGTRAGEKQHDNAVNAALDQFITYKYNGKEYTQAKIRAAAQKSNMSLEEYIQEHNIK